MCIDEILFKENKSSQEIQDHLDKHGEFASLKKMRKVLDPVKGDRRLKYHEIACHRRTSTEKVHNQHLNMTADQKRERKTVSNDKMLMFDGKSAGLAGRRYNHTKLSSKNSPNT